MATFTIADAYEHRFIVRRGSWCGSSTCSTGAQAHGRFTTEAAALARKQQARVG